MEIFQKGELKLLWPFYLDLAVSRIFSFAYFFMVLYFLSLGFSAFQIGILLAAIPFISLIFEIPTGAIADIYGRKFSVLLGYFIEGIGFLSIFFMSNFYSFVGAFALIGFGSTFSSGSKDAWVVDLIGTKRKRILHNFFINEQFLSGFGILFAGIVGAFFVKHYGLSIIWPVAAVSYLFSILVLLSADEVFKRRKAHVKSSAKKLWKQTKTSVKYSKDHPILFYILIASAIIGFSGAFNSQLSFMPYLSDLGLADHLFGYFFSALAAMAMISPFVVRLFYKYKNEVELLINFNILYAVVIALIIFANKLIFAIPILLIALFFSSAIGPVERIYFHKFIPSKLRATIGSVEMMLLSLVAIVSIPLVGFLVDSIGGQYTIFLSAVLSIPGILVYLKIKG